MIQRPHWFRILAQIIGTLRTLLGDSLQFLRLCRRPSTVLAAENLFLRKQLAFYQERHVKPRRATHAARFTLVWLTRQFDWRQALAIVQPATFIRWHRQGFRLFWRWQSTPGRPPLPADLQALIHRMAWENPTWSQERIANELLLKLGLRVSPRTVRKYLPKRPEHGRGPRLASQRWRTFVRNHAMAIIACDFCMVVTVTLLLLYVFVVIEHATRRVVHTNVTAHPTASWTLQQLREAILAEHAYRFLIHDRDSIFSQQLDHSIRNLGLTVLKTPPQSPQANAICERLLGTLRRECVDSLIPCSAKHLRRLLTQWIPHYNRGRPHMAIGPGLPQPSSLLPVSLQRHRHRLPDHLHVVASPTLVACTMKTGWRTKQPNLCARAPSPLHNNAIMEVDTMATERVVIPGIVKNGLVVPQNDTPLPEGAHVDIILGPGEVPTSLQAELAQWDKASEEAWAMIDQWETEDQ